MKTGLVGNIGHRRTNVWGTNCEADDDGDVYGNKVYRYTKYIIYIDISRSTH